MGDWSNRVIKIPYILEGEILKIFNSWKGKISTGSLVTAINFSMKNQCYWNESNSCERRYFLERALHNLEQRQEIYWLREGAYTRNPRIVVERTVLGLQGKRKIAEGKK